MVNSQKSKKVFKLVFICQLKISVSELATLSTYFFALMVEMQIQYMN